VTFDAALRPGFRLTFDASPLHGLRNTSALSGIRIRFSRRLAQVRTLDLPREKRLEISNFNTRSNLIALAEYKGSQLKPDHDSPADAAGRFRTTRWSVVLLSAQIAAKGRVGP
jgi:hypothetical protein